MHKCERCSSPATVHITEILHEGKFEEHHVCEPCYPKYLQETQHKGIGSKVAATETGGDFEDALFGQQECPRCGIKFVDFRNSHRLGCPQDYEVFRNELTPLLENIHGEPRHCGKTPRALSADQESGSGARAIALALERAVDREDYEEAARLRDQIKTLEEV